MISVLPFPSQILLRENIGQHEGEGQQYDDHLDSFQCIDELDGQHARQRDVQPKKKTEKSLYIPHLITKFVNSKIGEGKDIRGLQGCGDVSCPHYFYVVYTV